MEERELRARIRAMLNRHPAVGLAVGVVHDGILSFVHAHGHADLGAGAPVTEDTIFRVGSITKSMTAVAVMQLWERGLVDLDAPAGEYLRAFELVPAEPGIRPPTVRQLLTHTSGIPEVIRVADILRPGAGPFGSRPAVPSVEPGGRLPSPAEYYRDGLPVVAEPGSAFAYSNHGYAALGQIVEDVTGVSLDRCLRERIFEPLGMAQATLVRPAAVGSPVATGYVLGRSGATPVPDRDWFGGAGGAVWASTRDLACYAAALLAGGANERGSILRDSTVAAMLEPHYRRDRRLLGMGLGFFRADEGGHRIAWHDGLLPGFYGRLALAPDDGVAVIALTNGSPGALGWIPEEFGQLMRRLIGLPADVPRDDVPHDPRVWPEICGRYRLPARVSDLRGRIAMAGGVEVFIGGGRPMLRLRIPVPALYRGLPLEPDDEDDPYVFRVDLSSLGMRPVRLVFEPGSGSGTKAVHCDLGLEPLSFYADRGRPGSRRRAAAVLAAAGIAVAVRQARRARKVASR